MGRVLLIDDHIDFAELVKAGLSLRGHDVVAAYDGESALARLELDDHFSAVLCDLGLPGINGLDVARAVRTRHTNVERLVACTGWGRQLDRAFALEAGFDMILLKPVSLDALDGSIRAGRRRGGTRPGLQQGRCRGLIVVVDDEPMMGRAVVRSLRSLDAPILFTDQPRKALEHVRNEDVALLLTDVRMPEMSGIELAFEARALKPNLPVVFMTGELQHDLDEHERVVQKPFTSADLRDAIGRELLERDS